MSEFKARVHLFTNPTTKGRLLVGARVGFQSILDDTASMTLTVPLSVATVLDGMNGFYAGVEVRSASGEWVTPRNNLFVFRERSVNEKDPSRFADFTGTLYVEDRAEGHLIDPSIVAEGEIKWPAASAGTVMADLLTRITGHGITRSFTPAVDSAGVAWPAADIDDKAASVYTSVMDVLSSLAKAGYVSWWSQGTELVLRVPGEGATRTVDITAGADSVNVSKSLTDTASIFHVVTDTDVPAQVVAKPELGLGPRHAVVTVAGAATADIALRMATPIINASSRVRKQVTVTYQAGKLPALPFIDFQLGDNFPIGGELLRLVSIQVSTAETTTVQLTFGEIFYTLAAKLAGRTASLTLGTGGATVGRQIPATAAEPAAKSGRPTTPVLETTLGQVYAGWDGRLVTGVAPRTVIGVIAEAAPAPAGPWVQVTPDFTKGALPFAASLVNVAIDSPVHVRLRALNTKGVLSEPSDVASIVVDGVKAPDIEKAVLDAIEDALQAADRAQSTADGKSTIAPYGPTPADGAGKPVGALWWRRDEDGKVVELWEWSGSQWSTLALGPDAIAREAITSAKIATGAVLRDAIADAAVATENLIDGSVAQEKIANLAVGTAKIADAAIVSAKIGDAAIISAKIADAAIVSAKIGDAQIVEAKIADLAVTDAKIGNINAGKITAGFIDAARIEAASIATSKLLVGNFTNLLDDPAWKKFGQAPWNYPDGAQSVFNHGEYGPTMVIEPRDGWQPTSQDLPVSGGEAYLAMATILHNQYPAGSVGINLYFYDNAGTEISSIATGSPGPGWHRHSLRGTVPPSATKMRYLLRVQNVPWGSGGVQFSRVSLTRATNAELIVDGAITARHLQATEIWADSGFFNEAKANVLSVGALTGVTITGSVVRTSASGQRVQLDQVGLRAYNSSNLLTASLTAASGGLVLSGTLSTGSDGSRASLSGSRLLFYADSGEASGWVGFAPDEAGAGVRLQSATGGKKIVVSDLSIDMSSEVNIGGLTIFDWEVHVSRIMGTGYPSNNPDVHAGYLDIGGDLTSGFIRSLDVYERTYTGSANVFVTNVGTFGRATSLKAAKLDVMDQPIPDPLAILNVSPRVWTDRGAVERAIAEGYDDPDKRVRAFGAVVEEMEPHAPYLITREPDGAPNGIAYDRVGIALIPPMRWIVEQIAELKGETAPVWPASPEYDDSATWAAITGGTE